MKANPPPLDPRIRRTRQMLHQALAALLTEKSFEEISVQDIAERSTLNRATFYDHFTDKFALLEDMMGEQFRAKFDARMMGSSATCQEGGKRLILSVCDFLGDLSGRCQKHQRQFEPMVEAKIKSIVREFLLHDLRQGHNPVTTREAELRATMASWAIYGAALEWCRNKRTPAEPFAEAVLSLVDRLLFGPVTDVKSPGPKRAK
jgi:AcrR family transcriptional regulator